MKERTLKSQSGMVAQAFCWSKHQTEVLREMLLGRNPLANNPTMQITHSYTLIRPDEVMAAEFLWTGLVRKYGVTPEDNLLFRYLLRLLRDYAVIEAHTQMMEPVFERDRQ